MQITLESTEQVVSVDGVPARIWTGTTALGTPVTAYIASLLPPQDADHSEFTEAGFNPTEFYRTPDGTLIRAEPLNKN